MYLKIKRLSLFVAPYLMLASAPLAQTLDQTAYDMVWDKLETVLPANTKSENVHALKVIVPATWVEGDEESLRQLQNIASAIPDEAFSIDPSRMRKDLHKIYADFVLDAQLPEWTPDQQEKFAKASTKFDKAFTAYNKILDEYEARWDKRKRDLESRKEPIDSRARLRFRNQFGGGFVDVQNQLDAAMREMQSVAPAGNQFGDAVRNIRVSLQASKGDLVGLLDYDGGISTLRSIREDCQDEGPGWDQISFSSNSTSQKTRSSNWNANGGWNGAFFSFSAGGGGANFNNVVKTSTDNVTLRFCNLTYIPLRPGDWWDVGLLQAIDRGAIPLKPDSPQANKKILGPQGQIPRMVKGAVVARRIAFTAQLDRSNLEEVRRSSSGNGGLRIGPFSVGGGGGSTSFSRNFDSAQGLYGRSTNTTVPVILAIITEPTE